MHLHTAQQDPQFAQADIDAAIIIGQPVQQGVHYLPLFDCELFPVCSPAYLADHPELREPEDLAGQELLQVYPSAEDWPAWFRAHGLDVPPQPAGLRFESYDVVLASAVRGIGVALGQQPYMERDLKAHLHAGCRPELRVTSPYAFPELRCARVERQRFPLVSGNHQRSAAEQGKHPIEFRTCMRIL